MQPPGLPLGLWRQAGHEVERAGPSRPGHERRIRVLVYDRTAGPRSVVLASVQQDDEAVEQTRLDKVEKVVGATVGGVVLAWLGLVVILLLIFAGLWIKWQFDGDDLPSDPVAKCLAIGNQYQSTWWRANTEEGEYRDHDCAQICGPLDDFVLRAGTGDFVVCPNGARPPAGNR